MIVISVAVSTTVHPRLQKSASETRDLSMSWSVNLCAVIGMPSAFEGKVPVAMELIIVPLGRLTLILPPWTMLVR